MALFFLKQRICLDKAILEDILSKANGIHLEALATAAGTLKMGGTLCLVLSDWENLSQQPDQDSLR